MTTRAAMRWIFVWICAANCLFAQTRLSGTSIIDTFAGTAWKFSGNAMPATDAPISTFSQIATDLEGNVIFADYGNEVVSRLNANGTLTILAGNGIKDFSGDNGPALSASLNRPSSAVMDSLGNLYIYDSASSRIRRVAPNGVITTYAGTGIAGYLGDNGPAIKAQIESTTARMAVDPSGNLYFTGPGNNVVRRITPNGIISTYAGNGTSVHSGDNIPATQAGLANLGQIACDAQGNLYIAEAGAWLIRKVSTAGIITTFAGTGASGYKDGPALAAQFNGLAGLNFDQAGNLYVGDQNNGVVREISPAGVVTTIAGVQGSFGFSGDGGPPLKAVFRFPIGIAVDARGDINIVDAGNLRIRSFNPSTNILKTVAGNGLWRTTPDGSPADQAYFFGPRQLSFDSNGNLLIADSSTYRIRRINVDGTFQTIAGSGASGIGGLGGPATKALLSNPRMAISDNAGVIYIADPGLSLVYRVATNGNMTLFAGKSGMFSYTGDGGPAGSATLNGPAALALDSAGNLYVADSSNNCIRMIKSAAPNTISTFAGSCGKAGFGGDNGLAAQALLSNPQAIVFDGQGNLLVADNDNNRIRRVTPVGVISTIAGDGRALSNGNGGPAIAASINGPSALAVDSQGTIYFSETGGHVRQIFSGGMMAILAGNGRFPLAGDGGAASQASFNSTGVAVDSAGNVYISDFFNDRIRIVLATPPTVSAPVTSLSFTASSGGSPTDPQAVALSSTLAGQLLSAKSDSPWLKVPASVSSLPQNLQVVVDPSNLAAGVYQGNVTLTSPGVAAAVLTIPVTVTVSAANPAQLGLDAPLLSFSFLHGAASQTQSFNILNAGGGTLNFQAAVTGVTGSGVTLSPQSGSAVPNTPATIVVTVDPSQLPDGATSAQIVTTASTGESRTVPITITVAPLQPRMTLPQRGFLFTAVQGGGVTPAQRATILNTGNASYSYAATAIPLTGKGWLRVTAASGTSTPTTFGGVTISTVPTGLDPGVYYGLVRVTSTGTANSPQDVEVVLNLLSSDFNPGAVVEPSGLVFTANAGDSNPGSQRFTVTNLSASPSRFVLRPVPIGGAWLTAAPDSGMLQPGDSRTITVQASVGDLMPGVYNGSIALQVGAIPRSVGVLFVVAPGTVAAPSSGNGAAAACTPTTLYPVFTSFVQDFAVPASWPVPVEVNVVDDCGSPMTSGRVVTSFSNGDPPLSLTSLDNGRWQGTWFGGNVRSSQIVIAANANMDSPQISGKLAYTGTLQVNTGVPAVTSGGITTGAVATAQAPLSPGSVISISGANLAFGNNSAAQLPLATTLSGTQVLLGGELLPLLYTSGGLINAIVPYDLAVNAQYQIVVSSGNAISGPQPVTVAAAQPSIFKIDNTGSAQVVQDVWNRVTNGTAPDPAYAAPSSAIGAGDSLMILCTGLGSVSQTVDPTAPAPGSIATTNPVTVSIGGQSATPAFAGLAAGYSGLYQINVTVPAGVPAGSATPVVVSVAGQNSAPINVPTH